MHKSCQLSYSGKGAKKFNKPPPGPLSHLSSSNRMRLHTQDVNGATMKDRIGSSREHSPHPGSAMPVSPSRINSREKTPKDYSQILQDCSMCIAAYIQSLNTVCGTACRLAQCLSQVDVESGSAEASVGSVPPLKDAAELWEGVSRVVGVASANVKNQMLMLMQEAQNKQTLEYNELARKTELTKAIRTVFATFLNLQCQFSMIVVERFSGMLQQLKEESDEFSLLTNDYCPSVDHGRVGPWTIPTLKSQHHQHHHSTASPPQHNSHFSHLSHQPSLDQQNLLPQQLTMQHQLLLQQVLNVSKKSSPLNGVSSLNEGSTNQYSSGGIAATLHTSINQPWLANQLRSSQHSNTLSPGIYAGEEIDCLSENPSRRWSMGCSSIHEDRCQNRTNSLDPFSLIVNRRWSVPETTEYEPSFSDFWDLYSFSHCNYSESFSSGKISQNRSFNKDNSQMISGESSCTRSPSHSRSITPDQSRRVSVVSNEELQDIIDLLSIPLHDEKYEFVLSSVGKSFCNSPNIKDETSNSFFPKNYEINAETHLLLSPDSLGLKNGISIWGDKSSEVSEKESHSIIQDASMGKENISQISTSLWPPTDNVPGVTLTECIGEVEKNMNPPWSECGEVERSCRERSTAACLNRDSVTRASWPISSLSSFGLTNDLSSENFKDIIENWSTRPCASAFRRHSTDAPFFLHQLSKPSLLTKTRSYENIPLKGCSCNEAQIK